MNMNRDEAVELCRATAGYLREMAKKPPFYTADSPAMLEHWQRDMAPQFRQRADAIDALIAEVAEVRTG